MKSKGRKTSRPKNGRREKPADIYKNYIHGNNDGYYEWSTIFCSDDPHTDSDLNDWCLGILQSDYRKAAEKLAAFKKDGCSVSDTDLDDWYEGTLHADYRKALEALIDFYLDSVKKVIENYHYHRYHPDFIDLSKYLSILKDTHFDESITLEFVLNNSPKWNCLD